MDNKLWFPPTKDTAAKKYIYHFTCRYVEDVINFISMLEKDDGYLIAVHRTPAWDVVGQQIGEQFVILYQHTKELSMEVYT